MATGCKRKNRLFKQFQTADAAPKQWNRSKEVPANQGSNAIGAEQTKLAFTAGMAEIERPPARGDAAFLRRACLAASDAWQIAEYNPTAAPERVSARENAPTRRRRSANAATQHVAQTPSYRDVDRTASLRSLIVQVKCGTFAMTDCYRLSWAQQQSRKTQEKGEAMKKTMMALAAAATLAVSALAAPAPAQAQRGVAAGVVGGLIGGAIIGGAIANSPGYYGPGYGYYGGPAYVAGPGYYDGCYWQRQRFWDGYGWRIRRVRVCG
jgi:hypothetical protein